MLTHEQAEKVKKQLIQQIEKIFPKEKKEFAVEQIKTMNSSELEEFLKNNSLSSSDFEKTGGCIFCSIVGEEIGSYKIEETKDALAVLEINPVSKGHILVIPKEHSEKTPKEAYALAESLSKRMKKILKAEEIAILPGNLFGHSIVNLIPEYEDSAGISLNSKRQQAKPEELSEIQRLLAEKKKIQKMQKVSKAPKKTKIKVENFSWLPKRIP